MLMESGIYEHMVVKSGTLETLEASHLAEVAKGVIVMGPPVKTTHAKSCKVWHVPSSRQKVPSRSNSSDTRWRQTRSEWQDRHQESQALKKCTPTALSAISVKLASDVRQKLCSD